jgi:hypothetical protein
MGDQTKAGESSQNCSSQELLLYLRRYGRCQISNHPVGFIDREHRALVFTGMQCNLFSFGSSRIDKDEKPEAESPYQPLPWRSETTERGAAESFT